MLKMLIASSAAAITFAAIPAHAETQRMSVTVAHADLNLGSPQGQKRLERRIDNAARKVCGHYISLQASLAETSRSRACYDKAKADALPRVAALVDRYAKGG